MKKISDINEVCVLEMEHAGYKATLKKARRLVGDRLFGLPSGQDMSVVPIYCLPGCPDNWCREAGTYVVPVNTEYGLWFDWTANDINTAVIPSVKGMNPITGLKIDSLKMEQYRDKCPKHNIDLSHKGFCSECGHELPPQNYVSVPNILWWDGWRQPDGSVRQFFFTDEDKRDIASLVIGKENTVPAFGFAFFKTKVSRIVEKVITREIHDTYGFLSEPEKHWSVCDNFLAENDTLLADSSNFKKCYTNYSATGCFGKSLGVTGPTGKTGPTGCSGSDDGMSGTMGVAPLADFKGAESECDFISGMDKPKSIKPMNLKRSGSKDVSVGAGARIDQRLDTDKTALTEYFPEPQAIIRLYFVFEDQLNDIVEKGGIRKIENNKAFLENLPVG